MAVVAGFISTPFSIVSNSKAKFFETNFSPVQQLYYHAHASSSSPLSTFSTTVKFKRQFPTHISFPKASASSFSSGSTEYVIEPNTDVKFQTYLSLPGCSSPLALIGTGYREKVFAIIGVKVYAVGLYANLTVLENLNASKGPSAADSQDSSYLLSLIYQAPLEKSLQIILVRDIDGKTFWDALDSAISPRIKAPTPTDESALSNFRSIFQGRPLKNGTLIFLTWLEPSKMIVSISSNGLPSRVDATIESININSALFDVFFGDAPVSPSLKAAVSSGLEKILR
ncbi:hypothetical protein IFM89_006113 [Coptis chinensis]|uniref:Chalcone-flavonone isomerase family protein n=1 Tax=Coptis chinensis TaxID=261450 RepID=A0A835LDJ8_9MAGN|nr:hypothetical protein IFM89_006113 [Coptis chinensis]